MIIINRLIVLIFAHTQKKGDEETIFKETMYIRERLKL